MRNIASILQKPSISNAMAISFWRDFLLKRFLSTRKWTLPDEMSDYNRDYLTKMQARYGNVVVFKRVGQPGNPLCIAPATLGGDNIYGYPANVVVDLDFGNGVSEHYDIPYGEYAIFYAMSEGRDAPLFSSIQSYFAELCAACMRAVDTSQFWRRVPKIYGVDQKSQLEVDRIVNDIDVGAKATYVLKSFDAKPVTAPLDFTIDPKNDLQSWSNLSAYLKQFDMWIGYVPEDVQTGAGGRERVTATEASAAYIGTMQLNDTLARSWRQSADMCKRFLGVDVRLDQSTEIIDVIAQLTAASSETAVGDTDEDNKEKKEEKEHKYDNNDV